jgi:hypothetical protein
MRIVRGVLVAAAIVLAVLDGWAVCVWLVLADMPPPPRQWPANRVAITGAHVTRSSLADIGRGGPLIGRRIAAR